MTPDALVPLDEAAARRLHLIGLATNAVVSPNTRRAYGDALAVFLNWHDATGQAAITREQVMAYRSHLLAAGASSSTVNQSMSAIRKMVDEAANGGWMDRLLAESILSIKGVPIEGKRLGNWLSRDEAVRLVNAPDPNTVKGKRDRAVLAVLITCGLRRAEAAALRWEQVQKRENRWVLVDLMGKRRKRRSVPMNKSTKVALDVWRLASRNPASGPVFRPLTKNGRPFDRFLSPQTLYDIVIYASALAGVDVAPHDLRRTFAKLSHKGGADLLQIQLSLGHENMTTTERYLGVDQDLKHAPSDVIDLSNRK